MATRVIDDTKLNNIAVAIQAKDNGGQMTVDEMAGRIEAIPTGSDFDMTVTYNQVKMVIEVNNYDLSFWTRFGISGGGTVTVVNAQGNVLGSYLHGLFDDGQLFAAIAAHIRKEKDIVTENQAPVSFQEFREREFDRIADIVRASVDMDMIYKIVRGEV